MITIPKFVQIHFLTPHAGVALNRGDDGLAKRLILGDETRTRVSSQRLKRSWHEYEGPHSVHNIPGAERDVRSRNIIDRMVIPHLQETNDFTPELMTVVQNQMNLGLYGSENATDQHNRQSLLLGIPEINYIQNRAEEICLEFTDDLEGAELAVREFFQKERANFAAMREAVSLSHGLRAALYGRMITSYTEANIDGSIHVAHAFTTHPQETENDYFSSVDDLNILDNTPGAAYTGNSQLTSGIFYGYVVVDMPALVQNLQAVPRQQWLEADRTMAGDIVHNLIMTIAVVSPGAKKGSTAPYSRAALMLVEMGEEQPRSLAEAFRKPVRSGQTDDTVVALRAQMHRMDRLYGQEEVRRCAAANPAELPGAEELTMRQLAAWARESVQAGAAHDNGLL